MFEKFFGKKEKEETKAKVIPEISEEVKADLKLIASKNKIEAIKMYLKMTGCGLKEAKDFIESL